MEIQGLVYRISVLRYLRLDLIYSCFQFKIKLVSEFGFEINEVLVGSEYFMVRMKIFDTIGRPDGLP